MEEIKILIFYWKLNQSIVLFIDIFKITIIIKVNNELKMLERKIIDKPQASSFNLPPLPGANYKEEMPFIIQIFMSVSFSF